MKNVQPGIMADVPRLARHLEFSLIPDEDPRPCLESLAEIADGKLVVVGLGASGVAALGRQIEQLGIAPDFVKQAVAIAKQMPGIPSRQTGSHPRKYPVRQSGSHCGPSLRSSCRSRTLCSRS